MKPASFGRGAAKSQRAKGFGRAGTAAPAANVAPSPAEAKKAPAAASTNSDAQKPSNQAVVDELADIIEWRLEQFMPADEARNRSRDSLADAMSIWIAEIAESEGIDASDTDVRDLVTLMLNLFLDQIGGLSEDPFAAEEEAAKKEASKRKSKSKKKENDNKTLVEAKDRIQPLLLEHIDATAAAELERADLAEQVTDVVSELLVQEKINLNQREQRDLITLLLDDMLGLGPLEPLLADETITDIMINGPKQVWVEQSGKLNLTDVHFRDNGHLMNIATRIVSAVGRRVDETSPICDARLLDGSRVNVIIPPLAIDGASLSIRKFAKQKITLDRMLEFGSLSPKMSQVLKIAGRCKLNILVSGGTGSGKTTMLNALSKMIETSERVVTIEDAAELQLQQPHVVRLETRPANLEGNGEVTMRDLVKNALRMRPDRIILGEIRGEEMIDMLQAMNTGHDGSFGTIHANRPRECLTRMENMVNMAGMKLPPKAIRTQIADALHMIVQVSRMRDGGRRCAYITEVVGMEGDVITTQDLFTYKFTGEDSDGKLTGEFISTGVRPKFYDRAEYFGLGRALMEAMS